MVITNLARLIAITWDRSDEIFDLSDKVVEWNRSNGATYIAKVKNGVKDYIEFVNSLFLSVVTSCLFHIDLLCQYSILETDMLPMLTIVLQPARHYGVPERHQLTLH